MKRKSARPNVKLRGVRIQEAVFASQVFHHTHFQIKGNLRPRRCVVDVCDFCHKYIYIRRSMLPLRVKGWRMSCVQCVEERHLHLNKDKIHVENITAKIMTKTDGRK